MKKYLLVLFLLSLPPLLWWFPVGSVVDATDIIFPLDPILSLLRTFYAWDPINLTGSSQTAVQLNLSKFPIYLYLSLFDFINMPLWVINRFWYFAYLLFPAVSYFIFITELFYRKQSKYWIGLISAAFYVYNLYYVQQIIDQAITLSLIFAPLFLFFILKGLRTGQVLLYGLLIGLFNFLYSPINPNSYLVGVIVIAFFVTTLIGKFLVQKSWKDLSRLLQIITLGSLFAALAGAYFIIPTFYYLQNTVQTIQLESADWLQGVSKTTGFFNVIRLLGAWDWFDGWNGEYYAPFAVVYYKNILFSLLAFIPPTLAVLALVFSKDKWKYFFAVLALSGIFLSMGSHPPTGRGYVFLYDHLPFFWIFRSPWYKFGFFIIFAYSGLIGLLAEKLFTKYSPKKVATVLILIFIIIAHPLFLGSRFTKPEDRHGNLASLANFIPEYVFQSADWLNNQAGQERIVMVPQVTWESTAYTWEYGNLVPPLYTLLEKNPILYLPYIREGAGIGLLKAAKVSLYNPESTPSANYLGFLNAKYLINQKDFSYYHFRGPENAEIVEGYINQQKDYKKVESFGPWDIYETEKYLPKVYIASRIHKLNDIYEAGNLDLNNNPAFVLNTDKVPGNIPESKNLNIAFQYLNPVTYTVSYKSDAPFILVFLEAFDKNWKLHSPGKKLNYEHFIVNSYANGYLIKNTGDLDFQIKNSSQDDFDKGWNITFITMGVLAVAILVLLTKEKMLKSRKENIHRNGKN